MKSKGEFSKLSRERELDDLPIHSKRSPKGSSRLLLRGAVLHPIILSPRKIRELPAISLTQDFKCVEGWVVKDILWQGVPLSSILKLAKPRRNAKYVMVGSGEFTCRLNLRKAFEETTIIALKKSGRNIPYSNGGPMRLVFKGHNCYESVKWVDSVEVLSRSVPATGRKIALARLKSAPN